MKFFEIKSGKVSIETMEKLYLTHKNSLLKFAYVLVGNITTAEDIVHDTFISFARAAGKKKTFSNIKGYLMTTVLNNAKNYYRDTQKANTKTLSYADDLPSKNKRPEQWALLSEQLELLNQAMNQIPLEQREVVAMYMDGDMTFKQIAQIQELSISTVQGRFRYGIDKLRKLLQSEAKK